jgi:hypothetical protein
MKSLFPKLICAVIAFGLFFGFLYDNPTVAIVTLVKNKVTHKSPESKKWERTKKGERVESGTLLRTGEKSFSLVKFLDGSFLRIGENTTIEILGENPRGEFARKVHIDNGGVDFKITRIRGKFEFTTPLSVASIRGTEGLFKSSTEADTLIVREGLIDFMNRISNRRLLLRAGQTGVSDRRGNILSYETTEEEREKVKKFQEAIKEEEKEEREIEIRFRDKEGRERRIKIKIKER